jgi:hypothetical protein
MAKRSVSVVTCGGQARLGLGPEMAKRSVSVVTGERRRCVFKSQKWQRGRSHIGDNHINSETVGPRRGAHVPLAGLRLWQINNIRLTSNF